MVLKKRGAGKKIIRFMWELIELYDSKHIPRGAAALSFTLMLTAFPALICIHAILAAIVPGMELTLEDFQGVIPADALMVILNYLEYVSSHNNNTMLTAGILGTVTTAAAAFRTISGIMEDIQGEARFKGIFRLISSFIFSLVFIASVYFAAIVVVSGNWIMSLLADAFPVLGNIFLWQTLKYPVLLVLFVFILFGLYKITAPKGTNKVLFPGAMLAAALLVLVSIIFSLFINASTRYPLIYGGLASTIILMLWLYTVSIILITCNAFNFLLRRNKEVSSGLAALTAKERQPLPEAEPEPKPPQRRRIKFK
jgi:membrane protein